MQLDHRDDIAILRMNASKSNAMDLAFFERMDALIDQLDDARALVITGHGNFFSAGLALPALIGLERASISTFLDTFTDTMLRVYGLPLPVVAAVNGHAIAGGCVLALQADRRLMTSEDARIGLNEVQLGVGLTAHIVETLRAEVPPTSLAPLARGGRLVSPNEALSLDLVHALAPPDSLEERAIETARSLASLPPLAYAQIKGALRAPVVRAIEATRAKIDNAWLDTWFSDEAQRRLQEAADKLSRKK
ncbi:enoyl-CoA hydratase/isomerase family protein [Haliangium ochraceum]|uniref:Enoyl-CoA hydratase/isomerase n=1 Tax=Haliangium ochraceum (strain DSM 14365 / JCM 11303 / SMP-2) TaxID=502025 RepID=D0LSQ1_HALO1|nr:enoyl-CoA hydratase/isomerase family protein [Haliangium ochraceum]ACY17273.1 Enoyl-CoA hydratase/isomerase [Haliangium ochraceum DSM 14365]